MHTLTDVGNEILLNQYIFVSVLSKILSLFCRASGPVLSEIHCRRSEERILLVFGACAFRFEVGVDYCD
jgi:hypothetical protein